MERSGIMELFAEKEKKRTDLSFKPVKAELNVHELGTIAALHTGFQAKEATGKHVLSVQAHQTIFANAQANVVNPQELSSRFLRLVKELG